MSNFFNVIIPTYNSEKTLKRAVDSVAKQTFKDYRLIIVDDCSTDKTREIIRGIKEADVIMLTEKRFNGGSRNVGVAGGMDAKYTLFLDADDEFIDPECFQKIHDLIVKENYPDMVRLSYRKHYDDTGFEKDFDLYKDGDTIEDICWSKRVAPWTKAIKTEKFTPFPENTLFEDVVQHIKQCDLTETFAFYREPVVRWHIHKNSTSHNNSPKWQSSIYRFVADLMDLELNHEWAKFRRDKKIKGAKESIADGKAVQ
jgi:glycosyltransferase involved in cell wall biosynthesis